MAVGTMRFYSECLRKPVSFHYVLPNDVQQFNAENNPHYKREAISLYLLHGYSGDEHDWLLMGNIVELSSQYNLSIFTCTVGNNFYLDRDVTGRQYASFAGEEMVRYTRKVFNLPAERDKTWIGGLSMGGYGALHLGLTYPETFSKIIALSPALITDELNQMEEGSANFLANYAYYREVFGPLDKLDESDKNPKWQISQLLEQGLAVPEIYLAMGTEDALHASSELFAKFLEEKNVRHTYVSEYGFHNWPFWRKHIEEGVKLFLQN